MNLKKFFCTALCAVFLSELLFSYGGALSGQKNLRVYSTEFFQIIFPEKSSASAQLLAENADRIYYEIAEEYGSVPKFKMPVVITPGVETYNAYWVHAPYNHIVIYDTCGTEDLAVNTEQFLQTFRHELIHAFTYNMKNGFWTAAGNIFGDCINYGSISVTKGMAEGATMTGESSGGEGRLNDNYSWHMVQQAKIEGKFPAYADVQGASDSYPAGAYYYFNGAFHLYLQQTYGMEAYAQWWYRLVNMKSLTVRGAFKKSFGISLKQAWKDFYDWIPVPNLNADPVGNRIVKDLFTPKSYNLSSLNSGSARYSDLTGFNDGLFYTDETDYTAWLLKKGKSVPEKLFYYRYLQSAKITRDGKYVAFNYNDYDSPTVKSRTAVYCVENKKFYTLKDTGLHNACILQQNGNLYVAALGYEKQCYFTAVYRLIQKDGKIIADKPEEKFYEGAAGYIQSICDYSDSEKLCYAYIKIEGKKSKLCFHTVGTSSREEFVPSEKNIDMRDLSLAENGCFVFSWIEKGRMPSAGFFNSETGLFTFDQRNICGGVYSPVQCSDEIAFVAKYYRNNKLFLLDVSDEGRSEMQTGTVDVQAELNRNEEIFSAKETSREFLAETKKYNPFNYMRGIFIPLSVCTSRNYSTSSKYSLGSLSYTESSYLLPFGVTYGSSDPWNSGIWAVSAGYGFETNSAALMLYYQNGTDTSLFSYILKGSTEFDSKGWKQAYGYGYFSSYIPLGRICSLTFSGVSEVNYGRENLMYNSAKEDTESWYTTDMLKFGCAQSDDMNCYLYNANSFGAAWSTVRKTGPGLQEKGGLTLSAVVSNTNANLRKISEDAITDYSIADLTFGATGYIPKLRPGQNRENMTTTFPVRLNIQLFPGNTAVKSNGEEYYYNLFSKIITTGLRSRPVLQWSAETVLFAWNCQKAVPGIPILFFDDMRFSFLYKTALVSPHQFQSWRIFNADKYFDSALKSVNLFALRAVMSFNPNMGFTAYSQLKFSLFADIGFGFASDYIWPALYSVGVKANF